MAVDCFLDRSAFGRLGGGKRAVHAARRAHPAQCRLSLPVELDEFGERNLGAEVADVGGVVCLHHRRVAHGLVTLRHQPVDIARTTNEAVLVEFDVQRWTAIGDQGGMTRMAERARDLIERSSF